MMPLAELFESVNLVPLYTVATLAGAILALYVMQATSHYQENRRDPMWIQNSHRGILMLTSITLLWMFFYVVWEKSWQPHPPELVLVMLFDTLMVMRAITISLVHFRTPTPPIVITAPAVDYERTARH